MRMKEFDRIVGYETIKKKLERTADALRCPEPYAILGAKAPRGLLLYGEPGVGKTTMAQALAEASGRPVFLCRRDRPDGDFVRSIGRAFAEAAEAAPSVVFLDDLDKFSKAEEGCSNEEEYVTVQAEIDGLRGREVFVLATANTIRFLPDSLLRPGRFDELIRVAMPTREEAAEIIGHYLAGKAVAPDVDNNALARLLCGQSCAALETAMNAAGLRAGYARCREIGTEHLLMGCLETVYGLSPDRILRDRPDDPRDPRALMTRVACHEAGHVVASEALRPGSVTFSCIHEPENGSRGFTAYAVENESIDDIRREATCSLAGAAALELQFGVRELGSGGDGGDFQSAQETLRVLLEQSGCRGFALLGAFHEESERRRSDMEQALAAEMERHYAEAKRVLAANRAFLEAVTAELLKRGLLSADEIRRIWDACAEKAG